MRLICSALPLNFISPQLFFCLCGTEKICGKLRATHVVKNVLSLFQPFALPNIGGLQAVIQAHVAIVLKNCIVDRLNNTSVMSCIGKGGVMAFHFVANSKTLLILGKLFIVLYKLLLPGLYRKVGLSKCYDFLARIAIHDNEITGVP